MYPYMSELQRVFFQEPACEPLRSELHALYQSIHQQLNRDGQKQLLTLIDKGIELSDEISLASFTAGFHLAASLSNELKSNPFISLPEELAFLQSTPSNSHE